MKIIKDNGEFNWVFGVLLGINGIFWFSVFKYGFFISLTWTIVICAIITIWLKLLNKF